MSFIRVELTGKGKHLEKNEDVAAWLRAVERVFNTELEHQISLGKFMVKEVDRAESTRLSKESD